MEIPRRIIDNYTAAVNKVKQGAMDAMLPALERIDYESPFAKDMVKAVFAEAMPGYAESSAYIAAQFYDGMRTMQIGEALGAEVLTGGSMTQTEIAIDGIFANAATPEGIKSQLSQRIGYEIARSAGECVYRNGLRDKKSVRYARVPSGAETCNFCIMLASRGFVYKSKRNAGELNHYHSNCDCRVVPSFDEKTNIQGYDPNAYYKQYRETLEGHEIESTYDLMTVRGKTTSKLYKTASYDYKAAGYGSGAIRKSTYAASNGALSFSNFDDVKQYIYGASSQRDLEHRYSTLINVYGANSEQMTSQSMKNAIRHVQKRL